MRAWYADPDTSRRVLIGNVGDIDVTDEYLLTSPDEAVSDRESQSLHYAAIAIPTQKKSDFECPAAHIQVLDDCIRKAERILVIGWRGAEQHLLDKLNFLPGMAIPVLIVGASEDGTRETATSLSSVGLTDSRIDRFTDGFTNFLKTDDLADFLST